MSKEEHKKKIAKQSQLIILRLLYYTNYSKTKELIFRPLGKNFDSIFSYVRIHIILHIPVSLHNASFQQTLTVPNPTLLQTSGSEQLLFLLKTLEGQLHQDHHT
jgi:hypothetical protein